MMKKNKQYIDQIPVANQPDALNPGWNRRMFIKSAALMGISVLCPFRLMDRPLFARTTAADDAKFILEARYYEKLDHKKIRCKLCPRECVIDDRERGYCGVRENRDGIYYTLVNNRACTFHIDPVEKKPLFHFHPGSMAFSLATAGCNLNCKFCQNWEISQVTPEQVQSIYLPPEKVAEAAADYNCVSIAYTYSEPTIFYEYMENIAAAGHKRNVKSVVITAGFISTDPLKELCPKVNAIKVDLKSFSEKYYKDVVNGELKPVLDALLTMRQMDAWTEIVYLVVPTLNDNEKEITGLSKWIRQYLGVNVPVHFTRFHPQYLLKNLPPTPLSTLERCKAIADAEGLNFVYIGNVPGHVAENTYCPKCKKALVERIGFTIKTNRIERSRCQYCKTEIPGIWGD